MHLRSPQNGLASRCSLTFRRLSSGRLFNSFTNFCHRISSSMYMPSPPISLKRVKRLHGLSFSKANMGSSVPPMPQGWDVMSLISNMLFHLEFQSGKKREGNFIGKNLISRRAVLWTDILLQPSLSAFQAMSDFDHNLRRI